jgi:hypothetical protein
MNELNLRRIFAKIDIGAQLANFFNNTYKNKIVLSRPLDNRNLKLDASSGKIF